MKMSLLKILKMTAALGMLAVVLMMMMTVDAKAAGTGTLADPWECGNTGDGGSASAVTAYIDGTTLIIEGSGKMADYSAGTQPWNGMSFTSVEVRDGITWVGDFAFNNMSGLTSASIADTVTTIGQNAFSENTSLTSVRLSKNLKGIVNNTFRACTG